MAPTRFNVTEEEEYMKRALVVTLSLVFAVTIASASFAQMNQSAYFMLDSVVGEAGYQGGSSVTGIGANQLIGFGVYVDNVDQLRGFQINVTWEGTKATWRSPSGTAIETDTITINGEEVTLPDEANCLASVSGLGEIKETGHYAIDVAKLSGTALASTDFGLLFFVELKTSATFTTTDSFDIKTEITALDNGGMKQTLGRRLFHVNAVDVSKTATWGEIKSQFKD
jgi:hypothetical protein